MHFITGYSMPNSQSPSGPHFVKAEFMSDSVLEFEKDRRLKIASPPPPPREFRRKVAQIRRIKKDLAVHVKETLVVLDYILRVLFPIAQFNEGGERFIYTAAVF